MHCDHDLTLAPLFMLVSVKAAAVLGQPFPKCGAFHRFVPVYHASVDLPQTTERTLKLMFSQKNQIESNSAILRYINADSAGTVQFISWARCPFEIFSNLRSEQMNLPRLWTTGQEVTWDPFRAMRREMENVLRAYDQNLSSPDIGAGAPAINVAETKDAFEVTAELPGVDEKDIKVTLEDNQLVISGEKKAESKKEEKDWHIEERSYGSFYRLITLPFEPEDGAVDAHFDKGVLHLVIKKPAKAIKTSKTIDIKTGASSTAGAAPRKAA